MVKLGEVVKDSISGFAGVVIGRCEYLYGCVTVLVAPQRIGDDGKKLDSEWFDEGRLTHTVAAGTTGVPHTGPSGPQLPAKR